MMFYSWSIMDEKWEEAVGQYRSGKLTGKEEFFFEEQGLSCDLSVYNFLHKFAGWLTNQND